MQFEVRIEGGAELVRRLNDAGAAARLAVAAALYEEGESIMRDSKENHVPVDLGILKNSGHVQPPHVAGDDISVTLAYGGAAGAYAVIQHERLDFKHETGGPKYLERPLLAASLGLARRLANAVKRALR